MGHLPILVVCASKGLCCTHVRNGVTTHAIFKAIVAKGHVAFVAAASADNSAYLETQASLVPVKLASCDFLDPSYVGVLLIFVW